ncbi:hypothetical protein CJJ23_02280 [Mycoplasmopsis agassizii]|uniref:Lipoprotein associated domain n=1 Tax=Mycoplasmopsis agassizii TaxID=33922 RepID=A0A269TKP5_9BACT|nr:hypothetical protein [Mycoplasmopsis agassizii]PAK21345.1 hypothetical protein CJJ23_02280 [Mycoplasmopsis agassizii]
MKKLNRRSWLFISALTSVAAISATVIACSNNGNPADPNPPGTPPNLSTITAQTISRSYEANAVSQTFSAKDIYKQLDAVSASDFLSSFKSFTSDLSEETIKQVTVNKIIKVYEPSEQSSSVTVDAEVTINNVTSKATFMINGLKTDATVKQQAQTFYNSLPTSLNLTSAYAGLSSASDFVNTYFKSGTATYDVSYNIFFTESIISVPDKSSITIVADTITTNDVTGTLTFKLALDIGGFRYNTAGNAQASFEGVTMSVRGFKTNENTTNPVVPVDPNIALVKTWYANLVATNRAITSKSTLTANEYLNQLKALTSVTPTTLNNFLTTQIAALPSGFTLEINRNLSTSNNSSRSVILVLRLKKGSDYYDTTGLVNRNYTGKLMTITNLATEQAVAPSGPGSGGTTTPSNPNDALLKQSATAFYTAINNKTFTTSNASNRAGFVLEELKSLGSTTNIFSALNNLTLTSLPTLATGLQARIVANSLSANDANGTLTFKVNVFSSVATNNANLYDTSGNLVTSFAGANVTFTGFSKVSSSQHEVDNSILSKVEPTVTSFYTNLKNNVAYTLNNTGKALTVDELKSFLQAQYKNDAYTYLNSLLTTKLPNLPSGYKLEVNLNYSAFNTTTRGVTLNLRISNGVNTYDISGRVNSNTFGKSIFINNFATRSSQTSVVDSAQSSAVKTFYNSLTSHSTNLTAVVSKQILANGVDEILQPIQKNFTNLNALLNASSKFNVTVPSGYTVVFNIVEKSNQNGVLKFTIALAKDGRIVNNSNIPSPNYASKTFILNQLATEIDVNHGEKFLKLLPPTLTIKDSSSFANVLPSEVNLNLSGVASLKELVQENLSALPTDVSLTWVKEPTADKTSDFDGTVVYALTVFYSYSGYNNIGSGIYSSKVYITFKNLKSRAKYVKEAYANYKQTASAINNLSFNEAIKALQESTIEGRLALIGEWTSFKVPALEGYLLKQGYKTNVDIAGMDPIKGEIRFRVKIIKDDLTVNTNNKVHDSNFLGVDLVINNLNNNAISSDVNNPSIFLEGQNLELLKMKIQHRYSDVNQVYTPGFASLTGKYTDINTSAENYNQTWTSKREVQSNKIVDTIYLKVKEKSETESKNVIIAYQIVWTTSNSNLMWANQSMKIMDAPDTLNWSTLNFVGSDLIYNNDETPQDLLLLTFDIVNPSVNGKIYYEQSTPLKSIDQINYWSTKKDAKWSVISDPDNKFSSGITLPTNLNKVVVYPSGSEIGTITNLKVLTADALNVNQIPIGFYDSVNDVTYMMFLTTNVKRDIVQFRVWYWKGKHEYDTNAESKYRSWAPETSWNFLKDVNDVDSKQRVTARVGIDKIYFLE